MSAPKWVTAGLKYLGLKEIPGAKHNPTIVRWLVDLKAPFRDDETAWCGTYQAAIMRDVGITPVTNPWGARNWLKFGVKLAGPAVGAIVVFWRGSKEGWSGHVGTVVGKDQNGNIMVLGGNQGDMVSIKPFAVTGPNNRVLGYVWPAGEARPLRTGMDTLPIVKSDGRLSSNEA